MTMEYFSRLFLVSFSSLLSLQQLFDSGCGYCLAIVVAFCLRSLENYRREWLLTHAVVGIVGVVWQLFFGHVATAFQALWLEEDVDIFTNLQMPLGHIVRYWWRLI